MIVSKKREVIVEGGHCRGIEEGDVGGDCKEEFVNR